MWRVCSRGRPYSVASTGGGVRKPMFKKPTRGSIDGKTSMMFHIADGSGSLQAVLAHFWKHDINLSRIESRPIARSDEYQFFVTMDGAPGSKKVKDLTDSLNAVASSVQFIGSMSVPWFPRRPSDIDELSQKTMDAGEELDADHPGFNDLEYRERRKAIVRNAQVYKYGQEIPRVQYSKSEVDCWGKVWDRLIPLVELHGCKQYRKLLPLFMDNCGYSRDHIPQLQDVSVFLQDCTGFSLRPVAGLLTARDFFYGLAFRVFFSTQYIRHPSRPLYTPEPDIVHELMGHAVMFADPDFADFSQDIGLASIGATDDEIEKLARCYWYTVEFGQVYERKGKSTVRKVFGAGLLSSFGELEYSVGSEPECLAWDPTDASSREFPITKYQPVYYVAEDFPSMKSKFNEYAARIPRTFNVHYDLKSQVIHVDRDVVLQGKP